MNDRVNKASICSIVFLDIIDYSKKPDSEQIEVKSQFNTLINNALKDIAQNDRIILDTGDGAAIACNGSPEDALFISLTIRDEILKSNILTPTPLYVRIGINLGPVRVVSDINGQPNIIGDGINVAQRIMSFAQPNQILVSRSYYEVTSRLTQEISQLFDYSGIKHDKHVREHEIYSVRSLKNQVYAADAPVAETDDVGHGHISNKMNQNWKYALLALPAIVAFGLIIQKASAPSTPTLIIPHESTVPVATGNTLLPNETVEKAPTVVASPLTLEKSLDKTAEKPLDSATQKLQSDKITTQEITLDAALATKKAKKETLAALPPEYVPPPHKTLTENPQPEAKPAAKVVKVAEQKTEKAHEKQTEHASDKSTWKSVKDSVTNGVDKQCTQAEVAMNQCLNR
jgi:Adenylate and Guanylate cyclase catalytic domain